jgi:hypothetical protein
MSIREKLVADELIAKADTLLAIKFGACGAGIVARLNNKHAETVEALEEFDAALRDAFMYAMIEVNSATEIAAKVKWRNYYNDKILPKKT